MKLQIPNVHMVDDIRGAKTFRVPRNIILMILIYIAVFFFVELFETFAMIGCLMPRLMSWANTQMAETGTALSSEETMDKLYSMMEDPENTFIMLLSTVVGTLATMLYCRVVEGRKLHTMGFYKKGAIVQYLLGLLAGFLAFSAVVGTAALFGGVKFEGFEGRFTPNMLLVFIGFGIQGMSEETICRGFMMTSTLRHKNFWIAAVLNSMLFALAHFANPGFTLLSFINLTLAGLVFSAYVLRTGNIWGACAFHSIWNFVQGNFYGLPVSGLATGDSVFRMSLRGSEFVNGGDFGLESGIGCTIVCTLVILALLFVPNPFAKKTTDPKPEETA